MGNCLNGAAQKSPDVAQTRPKPKTSKLFCRPTLPPIEAETSPQERSVVRFNMEPVPQNSPGVSVATDWPLHTLQAAGAVGFGEEYSQTLFRRCNMGDKYKIEYGSSQEKVETFGEERTQSCPSVKKADLETFETNQSFP